MGGGTHAVNEMRKPTGVWEVVNKGWKRRPPGNCLNSWMGGGGGGQWGN